MLPPDPGVALIPRVTLERWSLAVCYGVGNAQIVISMRATIINEMAIFRKSQAEKQGKHDDERCIREVKETTSWRKKKW